MSVLISLAEVIPEEPLIDYDDVFCPRATTHNFVTAHRLHDISNCREQMRLMEATTFETYNTPMEGSNDTTGRR
jgi:hypothetical protein